MDYPNTYTFKDLVDGRITGASLRKWTAKLRTVTDNASIMLDYSHYSSGMFSRIDVWDGIEHAYFDTWAEAKAWIDEYIRRKKDASR